MARNTDTEISDELTEEELGDMVADTEDEIATSAWDDEPDENSGDRSLEQPETIEGLPAQDDGEPVADAEPETELAEEQEQEPIEQEASEEDFEEPAVDRRAGIPSDRLREEAERRRQTEAELNRLRGEVEAMRRMQAPQQPQQQPQQPQPEPDPVLDPVGFRQAINAQVAQAIEQDRWQRGEAAIQAAMQGDNGWKVQAAYNHLRGSLDPTNPESRQIVHRIVTAPDPASALVNHYNQNGGEERDDALFRQMAEARGYRLPETAQRQSQSRQRVEPEPRHITRLPKSLNSVSGHGSSRQNNDPELYDGSEESIFRYGTRP